MTAAAQGAVVTEALIMAYVRRYHRGRSAEALLAAIVARFGPQPDWTQTRVAELLALFAAGRAKTKGRAPSGG